METLLYIGFLAPLLPLLFFLLFKRKSKERAVWVIFFYILYCAITEFLNLYLQQTRNPLLLYSFSVFTIIEFSFICYYFFLLFEGKKNTKNIIKVVWLGFISYAIWNLFLIGKSGLWDSIAMGLESLIILMFSSYYLFTKVKRTNNLSIYKNFHFWIVITFLTYFSGTFFLNIMADAMWENEDYQMLYFGINIGFNILKSVMIAFAMTMKLNKAETPIPELDDHLFLHKA